MAGYTDRRDSRYCFDAHCARVDETERAACARSTVTLQLDAVADRQFTGKIERIGTIATSDFSAGWPIPRNFDLEFRSITGPASQAG